MGFNLGALLGGINQATIQARQEREQKEQNDMSLSMQMFGHIMENPNTSDEAKQQAYDGMMQTWMSHMFPKQFKTKPNDVHKLVSQFVDTTGGHAANLQQPGVGSGNSKPTQLGGLSQAQGPIGGPMGGPPIQEQAPVSGPPPLPVDMQTTALPGYEPPQSGGHEMPPDPQTAGIVQPIQVPPPPAQAINAVVNPPEKPTAKDVEKDPIEEYAQSLRDLIAAAPKGGAFRNPQVDQAKAELAKIPLLRVQAKLTQQTELAKLNTEHALRQQEDTYPSPIDIGTIKKGDPISIKATPLFVEALKMQNPDVDVQSKVDVQGIGFVVGLDKHTGKEIWTHSLGPMAEGVKGPFEEEVKAFMRDNNRPPDTKETDAILSKVAKNQAQIRIDVNQSATGANDPDVINSYASDIMDGRIDTATVPMANGVRNKVEKVIRDRIANGETPPLPLDAPSKALLEQTDPVLQLAKRFKAELEPVKDSNVPLTDTLQRALYSAGYATEASPQIAQAELLKVMGAARLLKGGSRAIQALQLAMQHLPNVKVDSPKLMYEKVNNLIQNLDDTKAAVFMYGNKYGVKPDNTIGSKSSLDDALDAAFGSVGSKKKPNK